MMTNLTTFTRWSGLASMLGGILFAIGIALHPLRDGQAVNASPYSAIHVLIAIGAVIYILGGFSLAVFGPESALVTIIETSGAIPFGLGFGWLGYALWRGGDRVRRTVPGMVQ
jgi:hypothetical protein